MKTEIKKLDKLEEEYGMDCFNNADDSKFYGLKGVEIKIFAIDSEENCRCISTMECEDEEGAKEMYAHFIEHEMYYIDLSKIEMIDKMEDMVAMAFFKAPLLLNAQVGISSKGKILIFSAEHRIIAEIKQVKDEVFTCLYSLNLDTSITLEEIQKMYLERLNLPKDTDEEENEA